MGDGAPNCSPRGAARNRASLPSLLGSALPTEVVTRFRSNDFRVLARTLRLRPIATAPRLRSSEHLPAVEATR